MSEITWTVSQGGGEQKPTIPYVSTWATFSKMDEKEKANIFNAMRAQLIADGRIKKEGG